jgi:hypothetical protein
MIQFPNASASFQKQNPHIFGSTGNDLALGRGPISKEELRSERTLQTQLVNLLRLKGIEPLWHRTDKKSAATVGWPDLTFSVKGIPTLWEVKLPGKKLSDEQQMLRVRLIENGWNYHVVHSVDEALTILKKFGLH